MSMRRRSMRARLLALLLGAVALVWLLALVAAWLEAHHELDELFDQRLEQTAGTLLELDLEDIRESARRDDDEDNASREPSLPDHLEYQVWRRDGTLLVQSRRAPGTAFNALEGHAAIDVGGRTWQTYARWNDDRDLLVRLFDEERGRRELTAEIIGQVALPLALALPLLAALIWVAVSRALAPLELLSRAVTARDAAHLEPLPDDSVPDEARPLVGEINALLDRLGRSLAAEKRFTADAAHELRTPLAGIRAQAQVARASIHAAERERALDGIIEGADRATRLAVQLLTLARAERESPLPETVLDLGDIAHACVAARAGQALDRQQQLSLRREGPARVAGDAELLSALCGNLIDNALAYAGEGRRVEVIISAVDGRSRLQVLDDGPGVEAAHRPLLLDRFYRVPGADKAPGSGLGLAIAAQIAQRHRATLTFTDGLDGRGFGVEVVFPPLRS